MTGAKPIRSAIQTMLIGGVAAAAAAFVIARHRLSGALSLTNCQALPGFVRQAATLC
ncbi:hypothetical protein [Candidatus Amarolinea dominans]|uniref:hypothetical protein n=1 Tax=Candidatus Amarolinea dominans TaxID=3140696 RepID=UPI0031CC8B8D